MDPNLVGEFGGASGGVKRDSHKGSDDHEGQERPMDPTRVTSKNHPAEFTTSSSTNQ